MLCIIRYDLYDESKDDVEDDQEDGEVDESFQEALLWPDLGGTTTTSHQGQLMMKRAEGMLQ